MKDDHTTLMIRKDSRQKSFDSSRYDGLSINITMDQNQMSLPFIGQDTVLLLSFGPGMGHLHLVK